MMMTRHYASRPGTAIAACGTQPLKELQSARAEASHGELPPGHSSIPFPLKEVAKVSRRRAQRFEVMKLKRAEVWSAGSVPSL